MGVPFNIASYSLLLHLLAHTHGLKPGRFVHTFGDLHIYNNHFQQVQEQLSRKPYNAPEIELAPELYNTGYEGLQKFDLEHVTLKNYECHPAIKAPVAV